MMVPLRFAYTPKAGTWFRCAPLNLKGQYALGAWC